MNPSPLPVTIRKDTNVTQLNQLDNNSVANTVKAQSNNVDDPLPTVSSHTEQVLWDMVERSDVNLSDSQQQQQQQLYTLLLRYSDIFATKDSNLGRATMLQHTIQTGDSPPIRQHTRRIPHYQRDEVKKLIQEMLTKNIIQPSKSPWASPVVIVRKKMVQPDFVLTIEGLTSRRRMHFCYHVLIKPLIPCQEHSGFRH